MRETVQIIYSFVRRCVVACWIFVLFHFFCVFIIHMIVICLLIPFCSFSSRFLFHLAWFICSRTQKCAWKESRRAETEKILTKKDKKRSATHFELNEKNKEKNIIIHSHIESSAAFCLYKFVFSFILVDIIIRILALP